MDTLSAQAESDVVHFQIADDHIAVVTLNRPHVHNAVDQLMALAIDAIVKRIEDDKNIRVAIPTSTGGKSFCAGADLAEIGRGNGRRLITKDGGFAGFVDVHKTKPWIAAIHGSALGGGCELMLACDMSVVSVDSRIGLPEVTRGLIAAAGGAYRLPRSLPRAIALEMLVTGTPIDGQRAFDLGLVSLAVAPDQVLSAAMAIARKIAANAPKAVRETLQIARSSADQAEVSLREMTLAANARVRDSIDVKEGIRAFLEKRPPAFTGE